MPEALKIGVKLKKIWPLPSILSRRLPLLRFVVSAYKRSLGLQEAAFRREMVKDSEEYARTGDLRPAPTKRAPSRPAKGNDYRMKQRTIEGDGGRRAPH